MRKRRAPGQRFQRLLPSPCAFAHRGSVFLVLTVKTLELVIGDGDGYRSPQKNPANATLWRFGGPLTVSGDRQHAVQCYLGQFGFVWRHADLVNHFAGGEVLQGPGQMLRVDTLHG